MSRVVATGVVTAAELDATLQPRRGLVPERRSGDGRFEFEAAGGPVTNYRRTVEIDHRDDGTAAVTQTVEFDLAVPWFRWIFVAPARRHLGRLGRVDASPWWGPPETLDARASTTLAALAGLSIVSGYLGTLLTQTITFAADEFGADTAAQGLALAAVRADILISVPVVAGADRRGRRQTALVAGMAGCALTCLGGLAPHLGWLAASQFVARGFVTALAILIGIVAAEEMPAGARAYAISLLAMAAAFGVGNCVVLLALLDDLSWRLLYAVAAVGLPLIAAVGRRLPESRRFRAPHRNVALAGHGRRFWLLAVSGFLLALFTTPAAQFQNEYLRDERGFSAARISLFTIATNTPGGLGIVVGGRLADLRGRRIVGAIGVVGGVGATVMMYLDSGWPLWAWSVVGAVVGAATVPALGVYGPELFPTSLRGRANGIIAAMARAGGVVGLVCAGFLAGELGSMGPAVALLALGPLALAVLVLVAYPETAHMELEDLNPEDRPPP